VTSAGQTCLLDEVSVAVAQAGGQTWEGTARSAMTHVARPSELMALLDIQFDEIAPTRVAGSIGADERHHQPWGIVHGGLYTAAIETFATTGAVEAIKDRGQRAVGVANATDFLRPHRSGRLAVVAVAIQQGRTQQLWQVEIRRPGDDKLIARGQVRLQNVEEASR
jgi:1,4-dihydroxy-2-naphthoyl-CoA hydrolase